MPTSTMTTFIAWYSASTLIDRLVGKFEFADIIVKGFADKRVSDSTHNKYDWAGLTQRLTQMETKASK